MLVSMYSDPEPGTDTDMDKLLKLISELRDSETHASQLFNMFSGYIRERFGACAMALVCTEGLAQNEFRILSFSDDHGRSVVESLDFSASPDQASVLQSENRRTLLNPSQPVIRRGTEYGIDPMFGELFGNYIDVISLPMFQHGGVYRWLLLLFTESGKVDQVDIERGLVMATLAINYVFSIEDARRLAEANAWIQGELKSVARIQQLLLPQSLEDTPGIKVARLFQPHTYVGGDYYEITPLSAFLKQEYHETDLEIWGFMIADASGHGAAAAVEIAMFDAILRTYDPGQASGPGDVLTYANRYFFTRMLRGSFITAFVSSYDPETRTLSYANAGHLSPVIRRAGSTDLVMLECQTGIPLGVDQSASWDSSSEPMDKGDLLVLYTDGMTEAKSPVGEEFGIERLKKCIAESPAEADACMQSIHSAVKSHQAMTPANDDQTLIVIQITS